LKLNQDEREINRKVFKSVKRCWAEVANPNRFLLDFQCMGLGTLGYLDHYLGFGKKMEVRRFEAGIFAAGTLSEVVLM
jgi:hypothetical protein